MTTTSCAAARLALRRGSAAGATTTVLRAQHEHEHARLAGEAPSRSRRALVGGVAATIGAGAFKSPSSVGVTGRAVADEDGVLRVGASAPFRTIGEALQAARALVESRRIVELVDRAYDERIVIDVDGVTIVAASAPDRGSSLVTLQHRTDRPYESTVTIAARGVRISGLAVRHASKSVANNYAVFVVEGASATIERCAAASETGSGFGIEGADATLVDCEASGCASHGVVGLGDASGEPGSATVTIERCTCDRNGADGVLIRGGAVIRMRDSRANENGRYGVELIDCEGALDSNVIGRNRKGAVVATKGAERLVAITNTAAT